MERKSKGPEALAHIIERITSQAKNMAGPDRIWDVWEEAVGEDIAKNAQPQVIKKGLLLVNVTSGPWAQQLEYLKAEIIERINSLAGAKMVTAIRFKVGLTQKKKR